jgi:quercetin dioxygenase-like cupin family protein
MEENVEIQSRQSSTKGSSEMFTGDVWFDPIAQGAEPSRVRVSAVRFSPRARTAWHSHALGQTLYVTDGSGRAQARGGDIIKLRAGDIVHTPPGEWHWHGAAPQNFMTHLSITEGTGDLSIPESEWGDLVTDTEYEGE